MIELPPKFKQALGNGVRTSLYPLVRIYEGYRIDDTIPEDAESINLSIKETTIKNLNDTYENYDPLLLNSPSIKNSADIINNKYTISSVSLSISNAPFQGKIFSDSIQNLLNAVVQIYYCANGIDSIEDCLLVYTGTIRRFSQSAETIKLELEDLTQQILSTNIPSTLIPDDVTYKEEDIGKPYPMVYGHIDKSPLITKLTGINNINQNQSLSQLEIDKPNQEIIGAWNQAPEDIYNNQYINNSHTLFDSDKNLLSKRNYLHIYNNGFINIMEDAVGNSIYPWHYITGEDDDGLNIINNVDFGGIKIYSFYDSDIENSANIKINSEYKQYVPFNGIPTRIYRPIISTIFGNHSNNLGGESGYGTVGEFYGFSYLENWDPREQVVSVTNDQIMLGDEAKTEYENNLNTGNLTWWQPTYVNENIAPPSGEGDWLGKYVWGNNDLNYTPAKNFDVSRIQNDQMNNGIHMNMATHLGSNMTMYRGYGGALVEFQLNEVGSLDAVTNLFYQLEYFTPQGLSSNKVADPTRFWSAKGFYSDQDEEAKDNLNDMIDSATWLPDNEAPNNSDTILEEIDILDGTGASVVSQNFAKSYVLNTTNDLSSFNWGHHAINQGDGNIHTSIANLYNLYILQDVIVKDEHKQDFYADIIGRAENGELLNSSSDIMKNILNNELNFGTDIEDTDIDEGWIHSFTLNEQKEAKEVFEGLFKSSLIIPSFNPKGQFKLIPIHQVLNNVSYIRIDNQDLLKYSFSLTKLDDIKNQVNVKYKKNYGSGEFDKQTGYTLTDNLGNEYQTYDEVTEAIYQDPSNAYSIDYYGLTSEEAKLDVETEYIRDELTAKKLQKRLVSWYANQHLIAKIDLPVSYMNLEVGDYIKFNELVGGKLAFGYDYTQPQFKNGQVTYPVFFITKINKSLDKISIEAIQVNRGDYGSRVIVDEEDEIGGTIFDEGGNDGQANFDLADPNDDDSYGDDTIVEEEEFEIEEYLNVSWQNGDNNLNNNPQAIINTNIEGQFEFEILITSNDEEILHPDTDEVLIPVIGETDEPFNAFPNYITVYQNPTSITMSTLYYIPWEELEDGTIITHNGIQGILRVYYEGTEHSMDLDFFQNYIEPPAPTPGDCTGDGILNVLDVVALVNAIVYYTTDEMLYNHPESDITGDGMLNVQDVVLIVDEIISNYIEG